MWPEPRGPGAPDSEVGPTATRDKVGRGEAPAKAILLGEHAVVYGQPAIAVPLPQLRARVQARFDSKLDDLVIETPGKGQVISLRRDPRQPLALAASLACRTLGLTPSFLRLRLDSAVPIASGLGSGAAVSTAIMRALADLLGKALSPEQLSDLVYEVEKLHHGTPSGIDNTVVAHQQPVYFRKGEPAEFLQLPAPLLLLVADTGVSSVTREAVASLRRAREEDPEGVNRKLAAIGDLVGHAREALIAADWQELGHLLDANHAILAELRLSSPELERLIAAARGAGALGAKPTGAGRGGHAIALVTSESEASATLAMVDAGARRVTLCRVEP